MVVLHDIDLANNEYFVKISSISGKDTVYAVDDSADNSDDNGVDNDSPVSDSYCHTVNIECEEMWKILNYETIKLIMTSTSAVCKYLLDSERIASNISSDSYLVFRKWIDYNIEEEFRCFIHNKKLVAISQYEYGTDLPDIIKKPDIIKAKISFFIDQIMDRIPFNNIIIDVAYHWADNNVYFIEFNDFGKESDTDAGLYDWIHDSCILYGETDNVDIRLFDLAYIERKFQI